MQIRHRVPTVFNIYMLDVICCALGCVILLWQVSHQEAEETQEAARKAEAALKQEHQYVHLQTQAAADAEARWKRATLEVLSISTEVQAVREQLADSRKQQEILSVRILEAEKDRDEANRVIALRKQEYDKLRQAWLISDALLKAVNVDLDKLKEKQKLAALDMAARIKENAELLLLVTAAEKKAKALDKDVTAKKLDAEELARRLAEQLARLKASETKNAGLEKELTGARAQGKDMLAKLGTAELRAQTLTTELDRDKKTLADSGARFKDLLDSHERLTKQLLANVKDLTQAKASILALEGERASLSKQVQAVQAEAEQRFAGITLSGKNVIFLVDISRSMKMRDADNDDATKWPAVCKTIAQLVGSIKGVAKYQVILFSDAVSYPLGSPSRWLPYDADKSPAEVHARLAKTDPDGGTNLYAAFAEAFRFRADKLDTIYLVSDGLPSDGEGLPLGTKNLTAAQKTDYWTRHLRSKLRDDWNRPLDGRRVRINSVGFFFDSPDVGAFLWALSREHDGSFVGMSRP